MCGILGYIALDKKRPNLDAFKKALVVCSNRGHDATGFYTPATDVVKKDQKAEDFVKNYSDELAKGISSNIMVAHARATTQGTEKVNANNHPHISDNYILVHNGGIFKSDPIEDYKLRSECDSEVILSYVETHGVKKGLSEMFETDSQAIALWNKNKKLLYLFRNGNPTSLMLDKKDKIIYFASTSEILKPLYRYGEVFGFKVWDDISIFDTEKDNLYTFSLEKGLIEKESIKQKAYHYQSTTYVGEGFSNYQNEHQHWNGRRRMKWCQDCHATVAEEHVCTVRSSSSRQTVTQPNIDSTKDHKRTIIYRGGSPRFIVHLIDKKAS